MNWKTVFLTMKNSQKYQFCNFFGDDIQVVPVIIYLVMIVKNPIGNFVANLLWDNLYINSIFFQELKTTPSASSKSRKIEISLTRRLVDL